MSYNDYLKEKFINLYLKNEKIGKHFIQITDFIFLNKAFLEVEQPIKPAVKNIEQLFSYIESDFNNDLILKNKIGFDFLEQLKRERKTSSIFLKQTPLSKPNITLIHKQELEVEYTTVANQYGLKEFYYTLNPNLSPNEKYEKAILLLNKTCIELENLKKHLNIEDSTKLGNGILSIQVNWQEDPKNNGYYNYCSNTICLKDENSTFPLVHEYIHFIDKTTTCLLLTGKTSQQLYEEKIFSQKELFKNFDMSIFSKIEFNKDNFPWIDIIQLKLLFKDEINQNKDIQKMFNQFHKNKNYNQEFKEIILDWIEEKNYLNKDLLKQDIIDILKNKSTKFDLKNKPYSNDEQEIIQKTLVFNTFSSNNNNSKNWSKKFDEIMQKNYYSTQKEMLARTIEKSIQGKLEQLSDRLTTPTLSAQQEKHIFKIIQSWQILSHDIINIQPQLDLNHRINKVKNTLQNKPDLIKHFKLK